METKASRNTNKSLGLTGIESIYDSVFDNTSLPESEKSLQRLQSEGALLVLASTESPAKTLSIVFYHLISNPAILAKLRKELKSLPDNVIWTQLEQLPYISAVMEEVNRLAFGVTARTARISYEPLTYIPSRYVINLTKFNKSYVIPLDTPMAFGKGGRNCLGIELARAELILAMVALVRKFEMKLWNADESDVALVHDWQVSRPNLESEEIRVMVETL